MKKLFAAVVFCLLALLIACSDASGQKADINRTVSPTQAPVPTEQLSKLELLQREIADSGKLCAAAYLGYLPEGGYAEFMSIAKNSGLLAQFPFLADIPEENTLIASGGEWYVLVPVDDTVCFTVSECILDETSFMLTAGKELLSQETGEPVLLCGNVSDIYPSFMVKVSGADGTVINYAPGLSLKDGSLLVEDGVYDFTVYE